MSKVILFGASKEDLSKYMGKRFVTLRPADVNHRAQDRKPGDECRVVFRDGGQVGGTAKVDMVTNGSLASLLMFSRGEPIVRALHTIPTETGFASRTRQADRWIGETPWVQTKYGRIVRQASPLATELELLSTIYGKQSMRTPYVALHCSYEDEKSDWAQIEENQRRIVDHCARKGLEAGYIMSKLVYGSDGMDSWRTLASAHKTLLQSQKKAAASLGLVL